MSKPKKLSTIWRRTDGSNGWVVECCEPENDGMCQTAIFYGPHAEHDAILFDEVLYQGLYPHMHIAGPKDDIDTCRRCGLDLRDPIHSSRSNRLGA